jgi:hypothetical protein
MDVSGHIYALTTLSQGNETPAPTDCEAGWAPDPVFTLRGGGGGNLLPVPGIELKRNSSVIRPTEGAVPAAVKCCVVKNNNASESAHNVLRLRQASVDFSRNLDET